jgi:hypothetical protein
MRRAREVWISIVRRCEQSGLTHEEFAEKSNIPLGTLRSWIYRLRREQVAASPLLPVRVITSTAPSARRRDDEGAAIEVELEAVRLRFPSDTAPAVIAEIVALLRGRC